MKDTYRERIKEEQKKLSPQQVFFSEGYQRLFQHLADEVAGEKLEQLLELGGIKKDVTFLVISGIAVICSLLKWNPLPLDMAWVAIVLCGIPIILEAVIGLVTAFDIKADVLVSLALIASICIGETFAAGEVAFIMQLGGLLEELTAARDRAGIEKLVHLTPQTARVL